MGRTHPSKLAILALIAALALAGGCKKKSDILAEEAPKLAGADLMFERIAVAGMVSDVADLPDTTANRENWSFLLGNQLGRERFGKLPIVSFRDMRTILGPDDHGAMLDRFKEEGRCDTMILADLGHALEGKARFIVFGRIQENRVKSSEKEDDEKKTKTLTRTRTIGIRLHFYDLSDQTLAWDHLTYGSSAASKEYDVSDLLKSKPGDGFLSGLGKILVNSAAKPNMVYPDPPAIDGTVANAFDNVGDYLKPNKKK